MNLDDLAFGIASRDQLDILNKHSFLDGMFTEFTHYTFPSNTSNHTKNELNEIASTSQQFSDCTPEQRQKFLRYDGDLAVMFKKILIGNKIMSPADASEFIDKIIEDVLPIAYKLKFYFQRPRPGQLAYYFKLKLFPFPSIDANSPAYPSAHVIVARTITNVVSIKFPRFKQNMEQVCSDVAVSRSWMGLNYQSDIDVALTIADSIITNGEFKLKYEL